MKATRSKLTMMITAATILLGASFSSAQTDPAPSCELKDITRAIETLDVKKRESSQAEQIREAYPVLECLAERYAKAQIPAELVKPTLRLWLKLLYIDPSQYATEAIFPAYKKSRAEFDKAISVTKESDAKKLRNSIGIYLRLVKEGNG